MSTQHGQLVERAQQCRTPITKACHCFGQHNTGKSGGTNAPQQTATSWCVFSGQAGLAAWGWSSKNTQQSCIVYALNAHLPASLGGRSSPRGAPPPQAGQGSCVTTSTSRKKCAVKKGSLGRRRMKITNTKEGFLPPPSHCACFCVFCLCVATIPRGEPQRDERTKFAAEKRQKERNSRRSTGGRSSGQKTHKNTEKHRKTHKKKRKTHKKNAKHTKKRKCLKNIKKKRKEKKRKEKKRKEKKRKEKKRKEKKRKEKKRKEKKRKEKKRKERKEKKRKEKKRKEKKRKVPLGRFLLAQKSDVKKTNIKFQTVRSGSCHSLIRWSPF